MLRSILRGQALELTLDRPAVRNALDEELVSGLTEALHGAARDPAVRAVVLTGAGTVFCAGADIAWLERLAAGGEEANQQDALAAADLYLTIAECPKPVVARVNGPARGGGVGLVAACDVAIAVPEAHFAFSEVRLGMIPAVISPHVIARMGSARTRRLFLTGETFTAEQALAWGLVDRVSTDLDGVVREVVEMLVAGGPAALAAVKELVAALGGRSAAELRAICAERLARVRSGTEARQGFSAFLAKRRPPWAR